jgi:hypothetical protein
MKKLLAMLLVAAMSFGAVTTSYALPQSKTSQHLKKDGTPDKRYKENKAKPVHVKKDGTPDKRFKENKAKKS